MTLKRMPAAPKSAELAPTPRRVPPARAVFLAFSAGTLGLLALLVAGTAPPMWFLVTYGLGFFTFSTLGVLFPQFEMYGDVLSRGAAGWQRVALTFDDGPHPVTTRRVLAMLAEHGVSATFFVV